MCKEDILDIISTLYWISLGAWLTCLFITIFYDNSIPMWISLIVMNSLNFTRIAYKTNSK